MPTRSYAQQIGDTGQALVEAWFEHPCWVARKQSHDFGIDLEAELAEPIDDRKQRMTGKLIKLQIKSSAKVERGEAHIAYPIPRELIHYADAFRLPVILAISCLETRTVWWLTLKQVKRGRGDLSAREWDLVRGWIPRQRRSSHGICDRMVTNAAIWISATGRCWKDLPKRYGCAEASYARYRLLKRCGALEQVTRILERELQRNQSCELSPVLV